MLPSPVFAPIHGVGDDPRTDSRESEGSMRRKFFLYYVKKRHYLFTDSVFNLCKAYLAVTLGAEEYDILLQK